jgi:hypothetical protein
VRAGSQEEIPNAPKEKAMLRRKIFSGRICRRAAAPVMWDSKLRSIEFGETVRVEQASSLWGVLPVWAKPTG